MAGVESGRVGNRQAVQGLELRPKRSGKTRGFKSTKPSNPGTLRLLPGWSSANLNKAPKMPLHETALLDWPGVSHCPKPSKGVSYRL